MEVAAYTRTPGKNARTTPARTSLSGWGRAGTHYFREFCRFPVSVHWLTVLI